MKTNNATSPKPNTLQPASRRPTPPAVPRALQMLLDQINAMPPAERGVLVGVVGARRYVADVDQTNAAEQHIRETGCPLATAAALDSFRIATDRWLDLQHAIGFDPLHGRPTPDCRRLLERALVGLTSQGLAEPFNVGGTIRIGLTRRGELLALLIDAIWNDEIAAAADPSSTTPSSSLPPWTNSPPFPASKPSATAPAARHAGGQRR